VIAGLRRHASATLPAECCGALIGRVEDGRIEVRAMIPLPNEDPRPGRYRIEAPVVQRLERQAAEAGVDLVGFYHSHPDGSAIPSAIDLELACPGYACVIVEPAHGEVRAWRLADDRTRFTELPLCLLADAV
jgi:proteasome lid subunit RPN8/RPN11